MKREEFIKHLRLHGCEFLREGSNHTVYVNRREKKASTVPRHREIDEGLCLKICKDLNIPSHNYQSFLIELCSLLGVAPPDPTTTDDRQNAYVFERAVPNFYSDDAGK